VVLGISHHSWAHNTGLLSKHWVEKCCDGKGWRETVLVQLKTVLLQDHLYHTTILINGRVHNISTSSSNFDLEVGVYGFLISQFGRAHPYITNKEVLDGSAFFKVQITS
jgi:hypothetical protein